MTTIIGYNILDGDTTVDEVTTVQRYETINLSEREQDGQYTDVRYEEALAESNTVQDQEVSIKPELRYQAFDITQYTNVTY